MGTLRLRFNVGCEWSTLEHRYLGADYQPIEEREQGVTGEMKVTSR
ncbi:MAG: hypothetical protein ABJC89_18985 [Acidobacteriota bacterium]